MGGYAYFGEQHNPFSYHSFYVLLEASEVQIKKKNNTALIDWLQILAIPFVVTYQINVDITSQPTEVRI